MVYVQNHLGQPLMPTQDHRKVRLLLKAGAAVVVRRTPFTIRLTTRTKTYVQPVILGVDAGSKTVGMSAATHEEEVFAAELTPRNDVVKNLADRREFRLSRRGRTTRYRQPRFNNRVHSKHKGWLAPSVEVKIQEHITSIKRACELLPIGKVVVETAEFDLQLLKSIADGMPVPQGENYQKGEMYGFYNVRQYVFFRDGYTCQCCGAHGKGIKFHTHHLESRKTGGNAPDDLVTVCDKCHKAFHAGLITDAKLKKRRRKSTRDAAFMGIMRKTLLQRLRAELPIPVVETRGYITKATRERLLKLPKSHTNDALAIAMGRHGFGIEEATYMPQSDRIYQIKPVRHHNRQLHKALPKKGGRRQRSQGPKYVQGFRRFDKVLYRGQECFIWGLRTRGYFQLKLLNGTKVHESAKASELILLEHSSGYLIA